MVQTYWQQPIVGQFSHNNIQALQSRPLCEHQQPQASSVMAALSAQWRQSVPVGCGLANLGNSCYLNSALQCLAHLPPLANVCLAKLHSRSCRFAASGNNSCICCHMEAQVCRMLQRSSNAADAPQAIHRQLHLLNRGFVRGRQEDAHELLRCLVDAMERALLRQSGTYNPQKPPRHPRTLVNALFGGILQSQVRCLVCGHASNTWDPCMDLSLELGGCGSVGGALARFTAVEKLDGDNKYRCEGCKQLVPAHKQITLYDDPNVLVIHLKRFDGIFGAKISRDIAFSTHLDLEPFMCPSRRVRSSSGSDTGAGSSSSSKFGSSSNGSRGLLNGYSSSSNGCYSNGHSSSSGGSSSSNGTEVANNSSRKRQQQQQQCDARSSRGEYVLHGVLIHQGFSANSGHYYAYVRDGIDNGYWHCMNDSQVYRVSESTVLKQMAYILFYVRTTMKQQAHLPQHTESNAAAVPQPAAAAAAGAGPSRLKRSISSSQGHSPDAEDAGGAAIAPGAMIGPQLPPHLLAKRQRLQQQEEEQQQQQPVTAAEADVDMFADAAEDEGGAVFGPQLPPGWRTQSSSGSTPKAAAAGGGGGLGGLVKQRSSSEGGGNAAAGEGSRPYFLWAQQQPQQQQQDTSHQQQQQACEAVQHGSLPNPSSSCHAGTTHGNGTAGTAAAAAAAAGDASASLRARLEDAFQHQVGAGVLRPWLLNKLLAAKQEGMSLAQSKCQLLPQLRNHPALLSLMQQVFQALSGEGDAAGTQ